MRIGLSMGALLLCCAVSSCIREPSAAVGATGTDGSAPIFITFQTPTQRTNATWAATDDENLIENIQVLAFRVESGVETFDYLTSAHSIKDDANISNIKHCQVMVLKKDYDQRFVLIANAPGSVSHIDDSYAGTAKDDILSKLVYAKDDQWHSAMAKFVSLPMWGESEAVRINDNPVIINTVKMFRMVSRIDAVLALEDSDTRFEFHNLNLYNFYKNGRITPNVADGFWDGNLNKAVSVTMPSSVTKEKGPMTFASFNSAGVYHLPSVYTFESPSAVYPEASEATCVVIGGTYGDDPDPTYYRVDFFYKDDEGTVTDFRPLLRNHLYRINIVSVEGSGYKTPDEAFDAKSQNMTVEVVEWDEGDISNIVFDGQYMLGVSQDLFTLSRNRSDNTLIVTTDYPKGWEARFKDDPDWIKIESIRLNDDGKDELVFSVKDNPGDSTRTAILSVTAGRLTCNVRVVQTTGEDLSLMITDAAGKEITEVIFHCGLDEPPLTDNTYTVRWTPAGETVSVSSLKPGAIAFPASEYDNPATESSFTGTGNKPYRIKPVAMNASEVDSHSGDPFLEKATRINYFIGEGTNMMARSITLRQIHYNLVTDILDSYEMDGSTYTFKVRSNGNWRASLESNPSNFVKSITEAGSVDTEQGTTFTFRLADDQDGSIGDASAVVKFTITCHDGAQVVRRVTINGIGGSTSKDVMAANSYIVAPGGDGINIPVSHANSDNKTRISANQKLTPVVIWIDRNTGVGPQSVISRYSVEGVGSSAKLVVHPGKLEGNALIGVTNESGDILWSWHIWVTDYDPDRDKTYTYNNYTWMDRNLGATTVERGNPESFGFIYQWGRKDPFPGITSNTNLAERPVYRENTTVRPIAAEKVSQVNNLETAIRYPYIYYLGASASTLDWYSSTNQSDNSLWGHYSSKTIFDPCPAGWRVAPKNPWEMWINFSTSTTTYDGWWYVSNSSDPVMGYWPMVGYRNGKDGDFAWEMGTNNRREGLYWCGDNGQGSTTEARIIQFYGTSPQPYTYSKRANGHAVRCVKDV